MGNKPPMLAKQKAKGYLPPGKRSSCRNCAHVIIAPYCDGHGRGIVYRCNTLGGFVAAGGICPSHKSDKS